MESRKLVNIGDGRIIEMTEGVIKPPPKKVRNANPGKYNDVRKKTSDPQYVAKRGREKKPKNLWRHMIPGYNEWRSLRCSQLAEFRNNPLAPEFPDTRRSGVPDGMRKRDAIVAWQKARERARQDMANIKKAGVIPETPRNPDEERAEEALQNTLEILRSPQNQEMRLKAARQVLEWTRAKPANKSEVTVNAAEAWLAQIAEDAADKE